MYEELKEQGFEVLDLPCNQFFRQRADPVLFALFHVAPF